MANDELEIHVLGCGARGESIVLKLPGAEPTWGVIDSFTNSASADDHPTIQFLRRQSVQELEFVALTHPHWDHYRGMSHILSEFKCKTFWRSDGYSPSDLVIAIHGAPSQLDEDPHELERVFVLCRDRRIPRRTMAAATDMYPITPTSTPSNFKIRSVAPSGVDKDNYEATLKSCFRSDGSFDRDRATRLNHNLISSALLVEFGNTRVVLGGDVEENGWTIVLKERGPKDLAASLVKVSHHGSTNGYCAGLWEAFSTNGLSIAVVTPYTPSRLPEADALLHIRRFCSRGFVTCVDAAPSYSQTPSWREVFRNQGRELLMEEETVLDANFADVKPALTEKLSPGICSFYLNRDRIFKFNVEGGAGFS